MAITSKTITQKKLSETAKDLFFYISTAYFIECLLRNHPEEAVKLGQLYPQFKTSFTEMMSNKQFFEGLSHAKLLLAVEMFMIIQWISDLVKLDHLDREKLRDIEREYEQDKLTKHQNMEAYNNNNAELLKRQIDELEKLKAAYREKIIAQCDVLIQRIDERIAALDERKIIIQGKIKSLTESSNALHSSIIARYAKDVTWELSDETKRFLKQENSNITSIKVSKKEEEKNTNEYVKQHSGKILDQSDYEMIDEIGRRKKIDAHLQSGEISQAAHDKLIKDPSAQHQAAVRAAEKENLVNNDKDLKEVKAQFKEIDKFESEKDKIDEEINKLENAREVIIATKESFENNADIENAFEEMSRLKDVADLQKEGDVKTTEKEADPTAPSDQNSHVAQVDLGVSDDFLSRLIDLAQNLEETEKVADSNLSTAIKEPDPVKSTSSQPPASDQAEPSNAKTYDADAEGSNSKAWEKHRKGFDENNKNPPSKKETEENSRKVESQDKADQASTSLKPR